MPVSRNYEVSPYACASSLISPSQWLNLVHSKEGKRMAVQWNKDADVALTKAKDDKKPLLIDFSAAPA